MNSIYFLVHPCDKDSNGGCNQKCIKDGGNYTCGCNENFKLTDDGKTCKLGMLSKIYYCLLLYPPSVITNQICV